MTSHPTVADIEAARRRTGGLVQETPLLTSETLSEAVRADIRLKLDCLQETRSFKLRGAANAVLTLDPDRRQRGVVTFSTGNHGRAVAFAAARLGVPAVVCVSRLVPDDKLEALREIGAQIELAGDSQDEAGIAAYDIALDKGMALIDPIQDPAVIAGHGTLALEVLDSWPDVDTFVVPVSAGGLASGIALVASAADPPARVVGVSIEHGAAMYESLRVGHPVEVEEVPSVADSLQGGIGLDNRHTFDICRRLLSDLVLVSDQEIQHGMAHALWKERLIVEGAGATPIAALVNRDRNLFGDKICLVVSGAGIDPQRVVEIASRARSAG